MKKTLILIVFIQCFALQTTQAQINESDTVRFQLRAGLTGNFQKGNVEVLLLRSRLDFSYAPAQHWVFKSQNLSLYQAFYDRKADNDLFSRNFLYFRPQRKVYPYLMGFVSANYRRKINFRYFAGPGLSWQVVNTRRHVFKLSASVVQEESVFSVNTYNFSEYKGSDRIKLWRGALYTAGWHYLAQRRLRVYYDAYWMPGFGHRNNFRTQLDVGMDLSVWKGVAFNVLYTQQHENVVAEKVKQDDRILTFGITYAFRTKR